MVEERPILEAGGKFAKGGNVIKRVEGRPLPLKLIDAEEPSPFDGKYHTQIMISLADAAILELMPEVEEEPELKENIFKAYYNYAVKGKTPSDKSTYKRLFVKRLEDMKTTWSSLVDKGERIILEYVTDVPLGYKIPVKGEDGKPTLDDNGHTVTEDAKGKGFVVAKGAAAEVGDIKVYIKGLVTGLTPALAKRALMQDSRAKRYPEYREEIDNGTLAETLGLTVDDSGKFVA